MLLYTQVFQRYVGKYADKTYDNKLVEPLHLFELFQSEYAWICELSMDLWLEIDQ